MTEPDAPVPTLTLHDDDSLWFDHRGSGEALFLVSGLSGEAGFWSSHVDALARRHLVVVHDHRGTGRSSRRRMSFSIAQMADDVLALADHLGIQRFHLLGHSTGGAIGQHLGVHHPERIRSLVLSATWSGPDGYTQALFRLRQEMLTTMGMAAYRRMGALLQRTPQWFRDHVHEDRAATGESSSLDVDIIVARIKALLAFDLRDRLHQITAPTLAMGTEDDVIIPAYCVRELAALIPGARLCLLPTGGHFYPQADALAFRAPVQEFLAPR